MNVHLLRSIAAALVVAAITVCAQAQEIFPSRPLQLIVPQPPGGVADMHARPLAAALERVLKQPVVVVNKPGAGSVMGTQFVANARADGYTLLIAMPGFFTTPPVDALFGQPPKFRIDHFAPIARLSAEPLVLVVPPARPWKSLTELVADAKRRPGQITYGSSGLYTSLHLEMEIFAAAAGLSLRHVPYNGAGPAVTALMGGHVDALASGPGPVLKRIAAGTLRALAVSADKRLPELPGLPTFKELGIDVEYYQQVGVVARKDTPAGALKVLRDATRQAVKDPEFKAALTHLGTEVSYLDAAEYQDVWAKDAKSIDQVLKRIGKQIE